LPPLPYIRRKELYFLIPPVIEQAVLRGTEEVAQTEVKVHQ
jgi:hypothetical protein